MGLGGDLDQDYAAVGFGGRLARGNRPAVLIVDVVMAQIDPHGRLCLGPGNALGPLARLAAAAWAVGGKFSPSAVFGTALACADRAAARHDANLFDMRAKTAEIVDCTAACRLLSQTGD